MKSVSFLYTEKKILANEHDQYPLVLSQDSQHHITDGSEFLDDAIRMFDQPFVPVMHTEESIAAGSPEKLL